MASAGNTSSSTVSSKITQANSDNANRKRNISGTLQSLLDDDFRESLNTYRNDPKIEQKYREISRLFSTNTNDFEQRGFSRRSSYSGKAKNILDRLIPRYNDKFRVLERLVTDWKVKRQDLIEKLSMNIRVLDRNFKWSTLVRFFASSVEVSGTVGGMLLSSETAWASRALNAASFCGMCGLFSTVAEVDQSKRILDELSEDIDEDYEALLPILEWFKESEELDSIVQELFPHGIDTDIVRQIQAASAEQDNYLKIFKAGLMSNFRKDSELLENTDFLQSMHLFSTSKLAAVWWNRIIRRKHPIILDLGKMALQLEFGQLQSIVFQVIPALPLEQQRLTSLPVAGRIMLNLLTLYDSCVDLKKGAKSSHTDKLRKQLKLMQEQLENIESTVLMMRPNP